MKQLNTKQFSTFHLFLVVSISALIVAFPVNNPEKAKAISLRVIQFLPVLPVVAVFTWASRRRKFTFAVVMLAALFGFNITSSTAHWLTPPTFMQLFWFDVKTVAGLAIAFAAVIGSLELVIPLPAKRQSRDSTQEHVG